MKRVMTVMLGLSLVAGGVVAALAQDQPTPDSTKKKKNTKKKKATQPKKNRFEPNN